MTTESVENFDISSVEEVDENFETATDFEEGGDETTADFESASSEKNLEEDFEEEPKQRYTVKIDGQEVEVELDELLKGYQSTKAAQNKFQEAAQLRKQAETFIEMLKTNPTKVLTDPSLGINFRELAEQYLVEQLQEEMLSPEEREFREMKQRLQQYEETEKQAKQAEEQRKLEEMVEAGRENFQKEIISALEQSGLPKNNMTIQRMAHYLHAIITDPNVSKEIKDNVSFIDVADLVKQEWQAEIQSLLGTSNIDTLLAMVGEDNVKKIRRWDVERIKKPKTQPKTHVDTTKKSKKEENKMSMDDFRSYLDSLK